MNIRIRRNARLVLATTLAAAAILATTGPGSAAGMSGQPRLSAADAAKARKLALDVVRPGGDAGRSRPGLMTLVEANATADVTSDVATALRDENTYTSLLATFEDAYLAQTKDADRAFVRYNILRTHLIRARLLPAPSRGPVLAVATRNAESLPKTERDPALWEVVGDLYAEKGDLESALAAYKRMQTGGAPASLMHYKTGYANQRANRLAPARQAYEAGIRADAGGPDGGGLTRHLLYQGLASLALQEGRFREAAEALGQSAKVKQDPANPFRLRLEVAYFLLDRGFARDAHEYALAAIKLVPDDVDARALRDAAEEKL